MLENLSPADRAAVENFCRELAFALRRILAEAHNQTPIDLAQPILSDQPVEAFHLGKEGKHEKHR